MNYFIGIDVSKDTLDVAAINTGNLILEHKMDNQYRTILMFVRKVLKQWQIPSDQLVICLEHTGMYNNILLRALVKLNVKICIEPALQIQKSQGMTRGKTDRVDARRIALYAYKNREHLKFWSPPRLVLQKVQALLGLRDRLIKIKSQLEVPIRESARFNDALIAGSLQTLSKAPVRTIIESIKRVERRIDKLVKGDSLLLVQCNRATSVPGIGRLTALSMIIASCDFQKISHPKQFACYAGIAPFKNESGTSIRGRSRVSKMANMSIKKLLHMAAQSAIQCCEEMKEFYSRKISSGKNKMSVLNAVRNKLISRVYACIKQERLYEKNYKMCLSEP